MGNKLNIKEYFDKREFVIPAYQRGYKWSVKTGTEDSPLQYFIKSLIKAFIDQVKEYFIESVTVVKNENQVVLVDGQQRTTSLFLLFVALKDLEFVQNKLIYDVRDDSRKYLNSLFDNGEESEDDDTQDIYYFKEAQEQIKVLIEGIDKVEFSGFIKDKVFLLYNVIPEDKAVNTFIALNGLKAIMKDEELIKSDLLIKSSRVDITNDLTSDEKQGIEWKINEERGRLARNWDKWLYWWNQKEVRDYFRISNSQHPLYYLLVTYWKINSNHKETQDFTFDNFKSRFIDKARNAKLHFEGLRKLQKTFEDLYNNSNSYNYLGLILKTSHNREEALKYFLDQNSDNIKVKLEEYAKWSLVEATHLEIINNSTERIKHPESTDETENVIKERKAIDAINLVNNNFVYWNDSDEEFNDSRKEFAFRFLLLLNLLEDVKLERKFDFSIWNNRSLEHIYPKSKKDTLDFNKPELNDGSIHCIGNLVLLYGNDNSSFGAKEFYDKKNNYFNTSIDFKSRKLLHTISVFSNSDWKETEIIRNKKEVINNLKKYYELI